MIEKMRDDELEIIKLNLLAFDYIITNEKDAEFKLFLKKNNSKMIKCKMCDPIDKSPMFSANINILSVLFAYQVGHNTYMICADKKEFVICNYSLNKFINDFNENSLFLRVSRQNIVNITKICNIINNKQNNKIELTLVDNIKCYVNRSYKREFLNVYCKRIGNVVKW